MIQDIHQKNQCLLISFLNQQTWGTFLGHPAAVQNVPYTITSESITTDKYQLLTTIIILNFFIFSIASSKRSNHYALSCVFLSVFFV